MRELFQIIVDWILDNMPQIALVLAVLMIIIAVLSTSGCNLHVGADVGITRTAQESSTKTVETVITSNPERIKDEATTD